MGALTSKPYAFSARPWELSEKENYDFNGFYSPLVKLDLRGTQLMRVRSSLLNANSEEWIADRSRFSYDSHNSLAIAEPLVWFGSRYEKFDFTVVWLEEFFVLRLFSLVASYRYSLPDYAFIIRTVTFLATFGFNRSECLVDWRSSYCFGPEHFNAGTFKSYFFVGFNVRYLHPALAIRFRRQLQTHNKPNFFSFGPYVTNSVDEVNLGTSVNQFISFVRSKSRACNCAVAPAVFLLPAPSKPFSNFNVIGLPSSSSEFSSFEIGLRRDFFNATDGSSLFVTFSSFFAYFSRSDFYFPIYHPFDRDRFEFIPEELCYRFFPSSTKSRPVFSKLFKPIFLFFEDYDFTHKGRNFFVEKFCLSYSSFQTHYLFNEYLINSKNMLLNFKRNQDVRHSYIYFL